MISSTESIIGRMYMKKPSDASLVLHVDAVERDVDRRRRQAVDRRSAGVAARRLDARQADDVVERRVRDDRQLLDLLDRDGRLHRRALRLHDLGRAGDDDRLFAGRRSSSVTLTDAGVAGHNLDVRRDGRLEPWQRDRHRVGARRRRRPS